MKILIKETGEILEDVKFIDTTLHNITIQYLDDGVLRECSVKNFSDIEEVKDYEEPKTFWYIRCFGEVYEDESDASTEHGEKHKEIGNYFETREEAEKAVEKLKAWKRLKDKGFRFIPEASYVEEQPKETGKSMMFIACTMNDYRDFVFGDNADIKLLFGGEE